MGIDKYSNNFFIIGIKNKILSIKKFISKTDCTEKTKDQNKPKCFFRTSLQQDKEQHSHNSGKSTLRKPCDS